MPSRPCYLIRLTLEGTTSILFHRFHESNDPINYVYRDSAGHLSIPADNIKRAILQAAKDNNIFIGPIDVIETYCKIITNTGDFAKTWDYVDQRLISDGHKGKTLRERPAMKKGWCTVITLIVGTEIKPALIINATTKAGLAGICDSRPRYGRFHILDFELIDGNMEDTNG